jgi:hypothetical protein
MKANEEERKKERNENTKSILRSQIMVVRDPKTKNSLK